MREIEGKTNLIFTNRVLDGKAFMLLNRVIGPDNSNPNVPYIDGPSFAEEMYWLKSQGLDITVKINSPGGRVDHGHSIIDAIRTTGANTHLIGLGASMAGICFLFGKTRIADEHSTLMVHAPRGGSKQYCEMIKEQFASLITNFTKLPKDKADSLMDGKDYYFDISDMEDYGFVDSVINTGKKFMRSQTASAMELFDTYNSIIQEDSQLTINNKMTEMFAKIFGGKTESENLVSAVQMKAENEALKASNTQLSNDINALKEKLKSLEAEQAKLEAKEKGKELIESAIKANKMKFKDDAEKAKAIDNATASYDAVKLMIDSMPSQKTSAAAAIIDHEGKSKNLTYEQLAKSNPELLSQIAENDPELFNKLSDEYNESQRTKESK